VPAVVLRGVCFFEIALFHQSREASVLFLDLLALGGATSTTPEDARGLHELRHTTDTHDSDFAHDNTPTSDDGDDASRVSSDFSWSV
jgi:hypothetical protein